MGLAGFNRARQRLQVGASAPAKVKPIYKEYKAESERPYCYHCEKFFQNANAHKIHMKNRHKEDV